MSAARVVTIGLGLFLLLVSPLPAQEQPQKQENIWQSDWEAEEAARSEAFAQRVLEAVKERDPQRAEELRKLYEENADRFWEEVRREFRDRQRDSQAPDRPGDRPRGQRDTRPGERERGRGPENDRNPWQEHLQRQHEEFMKWLEEKDPAYAAELTEMKEKNPEEYLNQSREAWRRYEPIMRAEWDNPELARIMMQDLNLQKQRDDILRRLRTSNGEDKEVLMKELEKVVSARFDLIILKKQMMYDELHRRLQKLQQELEKRQSELAELQNTKQQNVQDRIRELTTQVEKINWD